MATLYLVLTIQAEQHKLLTLVMASFEHLGRALVPLSLPQKPKIMNFTTILFLMCYLVIPGFCFIFTNCCLHVYTYSDRVDIQEMCTLPYHHMMDTDVEQRFNSSFPLLKSILC